MLKKAATKNFRLRIWAHSLGEYLYILTKNRLTLKHRTYAINQTDDDFLESDLSNVKKGVWYIGGKKKKTEERCHTIRTICIYWSTYIRRNS